MFKGTPESHELCRLMARLCGGKCLLAFSRGKDSLAAWLYLRNYFDEIIPYTGIFVPGLKFVDRSLAYYEDVMQTPIRRFMFWTFSVDMANCLWQPFGMVDHIDSQVWPWFELPLVESLFCEELGWDYDKTWTAHGFSIYDSLDRMGWVKRVKGKHSSRGHFYPCWNWKPSEITQYIKQNGVSLSEDYLLTNRSLESTPNWKNLEMMEKHFPEDYETVKEWFPLIEARLARQKFRELHFQGE